MAISKEQEKWNEAVSKAQEAIQKLIDIQEECQSKYDELTEKQQEGPEGDLLTLVCDLDLQGTMDNLIDAADIEIP